MRTSRNQSQYFASTDCLYLKMFIFNIIQRGSVQLRRLRLYGLVIRQWNKLYGSVMALERIGHPAKSPGRVKFSIKLGAIYTPFNRIKLPNHATFFDASVIPLITHLGVSTAHVVDGFSASWFLVLISVWIHFAALPQHIETAWRKYADHNWSR